MKKFVNQNKLYLLLALLIVFFVVIALVFFFSNPKLEPNQTVNNSTSDFVFDENKYKVLVRDIFSRLSINEPDLARALKQELLAMTVSKEFKDAHYSLVMASVAVEDYATSRSTESLNQAQKLLDKLKQDYKWLAD